jgi:dihydrofolate synthase/folylpolyglutamate synthase
VGGTTGKGSTAAMAAAILEEAGLSVGLYVSPFLQTFVERISVNGELIAPDQFADAVEAVKPAVSKLEQEGLGRPTILEVLFVIGMQHFQRENVDVAVVEVGLGGRTDCTNVFDPPTVAAITNVQLDHIRQLGNTPAAIATEKKAIIKSGGLAVTGATGEALDVLTEHCRMEGVQLWRAGHEITLKRIGCAALVTTPARTVRVKPAMAGKHQQDNAALAVAAVDAFAERTGQPIANAAGAAGIARARQPGRLEIVQQKPRVILDGAHNPAAAAILAEALATPDMRSSGALLMFIGILEDKDREGVLERLVPIADHVVITTPPLEQRAGNSSEVFAIAQRYRRGHATIQLMEDPLDALQRVLELAEAEDTVCITGSIYLIGLLRSHWFPEEVILAERRLRYATF